MLSDIDLQILHVRFKLHVCTFHKMVITLTQALSIIPSYNLKIHHMLSKYLT